MRHVAEGVLRRLDDEPLAVPDNVTDHVAGCRALQRAASPDRRRHGTRGPAVGRPGSSFPTPTRPGRGSSAICAATARGGSRTAPAAEPPVSPARGAGFRGCRCAPALVIGAVGIVIAGTAAAATLTTIFAPTHVAPVSLSQGDLRAITSFTGLDDSHALGGFSDPEWIEHASVRNHHLVLLRHRPSGVLAGRGDRGCRLSGVTAHPRSRGGGRRPAGRRSAARERYRDLQLGRRGPRAELGDP